MAKIDSIDLSKERLLDLASYYMEQHNYVGALKLIRKNEEQNGLDDDTYMMYAEVYDDLELSEECINSWFRYLDSAEDPDLAEAYEGLAVSFLHMGEEDYAAYYYDKLLKVTQKMSEEVREEIIDCFIKNDDSPLKFAYPPEKMDVEDIIDEGLEYIRDNEFKKAVKTFSEVPPAHKKYLQARNHIAMTHILSGDCAKAEKECKRILAQDNSNVQALTTLAAVKNEQDKPDEALEITRELLALNVTDMEDIYKVATVCCENKLHDEAYKLFCKLDESILIKDRGLLFFKAMAAYNSGRGQECTEALDLILTLYPDAVVAAYYRTYVMEHPAEDKDRAELDYYYRLPDDMRKKNIALITLLFRLKESHVKKLQEEVDALACIKWSFEEGDKVGDGTELQTVASICAVKLGYDDYVRELLLDAFLPDEIKSTMLHFLCERNKKDIFSFVYDMGYKVIELDHVKLGNKKRKMFLCAYAMLIGRLGVLDPDSAPDFARECERIYAILKENDKLDLCIDENTLAAAIFLESGMYEKLNLEKVMDIEDYFGVNYKNLLALLNEL